MGKFHKAPSKFLSDRKPFLSKSCVQSIGYARTTNPNNQDKAQIASLRQAGCATIFQENSISGKESGVSKFKEAIKSLKRGDELVIMSLDRLGHDKNCLIARLNYLHQKSIHLRTIDGLVNTKELGELGISIISLLSGLLEIDKLFIKERAIKSVEYRKEKGGNLGGRPKISSIKENLVLNLREQGFSYRCIREQTGLSLSTIRRVILDLS